MKKAEKVKDTARHVLPAEMAFLSAIREKMGQFTPAQQSLAEYLIHNPESILFLSINNLARAAEISQATVVRFCNIIGYDGYSQMTKEAQQFVHSQMSTAGRFKLTRSRRDKTANVSDEKKEASAFERMLTHEQENLNRLAKSIKVRDFNWAVDKVLNADRVVIIGCMASASLAAHFGRMLGKVFPKIDVINSEGVLESTKLLRLTRDSIVILIAFPRYPNATIRLGQAALKSGAKTIAITDSHLSPISHLGDVAFHIYLGMPSYVDAYAAPLTFINAICTEIAEKMSGCAVQNLDRFDRLAEESQLFFKLTKRGRRNQKKADDTGLKRIRGNPPRRSPEP